MTTSIDKILSNIKSRTDIAANEISKFQISLSENPAYAMKWSESIYNSAATLQVSHHLNHMIEHAQESNGSEPMIIAELLNWSQKEVLKRSSFYPAGSSTANLMQMAVLREWSAICALLEA